MVLTCLSPNRTLISIICFAAGVVADREFQSYTTLEYKKTAINWRRMNRDSKRVRGFGARGRMPASSAQRGPRRALR